MSINILKTLSPLTYAATIGELDGIKKAILEGADPKKENSIALGYAAENGHVECVNFLIPISNPQDNASAALQWAALRGHSDCVKLLLLVSDFKEASQSLKKRNLFNAANLIDSLLQQQNLSEKFTSKKKQNEAKKEL